MKVFGPGYTEINTSNDTGQPIYPIEDYEKIRRELLEEVKIKRGEFIAKCGDIDNALGEAIGWFFFERNKTNKEIFSNLILRTDFFSFGQKKKVVESLLKNHRDRYVTVTEENKKKFFVDLMKIIRQRNILAHGEVIIDMKNKKAQMSYYDSSQLRNVIIDIDSKFFYDLQLRIGFVLGFCFEHLIYPEQLSDTS